MDETAVFGRGELVYGWNPAAVDGAYVPALAGCRVELYDGMDVLQESWAYDAEGRRIEQTEVAYERTTTWEWDGACMVVELRSDPFVDVWTEQVCGRGDWATERTETYGTDADTADVVLIERTWVGTRMKHVVEWRADGSFRSARSLDWDARGRIVRERWLGEDLAPLGIEGSWEWSADRLDARRWDSGGRNYTYNGGRLTGELDLDGNPRVLYAYDGGKRPSKFAYSSGVHLWPTYICP